MVGGTCFVGGSRWQNCGVYNARFSSLTGEQPKKLGNFLKDLRKLGSLTRRWHEVYRSEYLKYGLRAGVRACLRLSNSIATNYRRVVGKREGGGMHLVSATDLPPPPSGKSGWP